VTLTSVTSPLKRVYFNQEVFHYESQKGEEWIPFDVARDDKTKIVMNLNVQRIKQSCYYFINSKVYGLII
jgi:hypothetical protein